MNHKARPKVILFLLGLALATVAFRAPLQRMFFEHAALGNDAPAPEVISQMIEQAADPRPPLLAAWRTGKIVHREVAVGEVRQLCPPSQPIPAPFEALLFEAALDPDANVRESALAVLNDHHHASLIALAAEQLKDLDPQARLLGLNYLKHAEPAIGVPVAAGLLSDPDPAVLGTTVKLLERWSGEKFGAKLADAVQIVNQTTGLEEYQPGGKEKSEAAATKARSWWTAHHDEFPAAISAIPTQSGTRQAVPAADFALRTLEGNKVRLSDYRGRVVLINFWTTWCPGCVGEIPALVALRKKHGDDLVILGVSLDFVPHEDADTTDPAAPRQILEKVSRTAKARDINYPVLLDQQNEAGGRYNGGELPTTVIVDAQGKVRRRFVGPRSLAVLEAMITEASHEAAK